MEPPCHAKGSRQGLHLNGQYFPEEKHFGWPFDINRFATGKSILGAYIVEVFVLQHARAIEADLALEQSRRLVILINPSRAKSGLRN